MDRTVNEMGTHVTVLSTVSDSRDGCFGLCCTYIHQKSRRKVEFLSISLVSIAKNGIRPVYPKGTRAPVLSTTSAIVAVSPTREDFCRCVTIAGGTTR